MLLHHLHHLHLLLLYHLHFLYILSLQFYIALLEHLVLRHRTGTRHRHHLRR